MQEKKLSIELTVTSRNFNSKIMRPNSSIKYASMFIGIIYTRIYIHSVIREYLMTYIY